MAKVSRLAMLVTLNNIPRNLCLSHRGGDRGGGLIKAKRKQSRLLKFREDALRGYLGLPGANAQLTLLQADQRPGHTNSHHGSSAASRD
jgi:hypothetical protein